MADVRMPNNTANLNKTTTPSQTGATAATQSTAAAPAAGKAGMAHMAASMSPTMSADAVKGMGSLLNAKNNRSMSNIQEEMAKAPTPHSETKKK